MRTYECVNIISQENYDEVKSKVTSTVNKMSSSVAAAASVVVDATKNDDDGKGKQEGK